MDDTTTKARQSANIANLSKAMAVAQVKFRPAARGTENPSFGSRYADLEAVTEVLREPLAANGLWYTQETEVDEQGRVIVETIIRHTSGEFLRAGRIVMRPTADGPQPVGSCLTYARRYGLAAAFGVVAQGEDDDGERAQGRSGKPTSSPAAPTAAPEAAPKAVPLAAAPAAPAAKPALDRDGVKDALAGLPEKTDAGRVARDLGALLALLPDQASRERALGTAWAESKLQGTVPAGPEAWNGIPAATSCLLYARLRERLAKYAGVAPEKAAATEKAPEPKKEPAPAKPAKAPEARPAHDPKAVATAAAAAGESIDEFLDALEGGDE